MSRYRITQSLLSKWQYMFDATENAAENAQVEFLNTLRRVPESEPTPAMIKGIKFEEIVTNLCKGVDDESYRLHPTAFYAAKELMGCQFQVNIFKPKTINGNNFLLHGVLDGLKCGAIYDIKFSESYEIGKYLNSPQHPMYLDLVPEAKSFTYLISDGKELFKETYLRSQVESIDTTIIDFINYLNDTKLIKDYQKYWKCK